MKCAQLVGEKPTSCAHEFISVSLIKIMAKFAEAEVTLL